MASIGHPQGCFAFCPGAKNAIFPVSFMYVSLKLLLFHTLFSQPMPFFFINEKAPIKGTSPNIKCSKSLKSDEVCFLDGI